MENNYLHYNINIMNRNELYRQAKNLATDLGYDLQPLRQAYRRSTTDYWQTEVRNYQRNIRNRNNTYNRALRISRENREPLARVAIQQGTDYAYWQREVRRLQMRARRNPLGIQAVQQARARVAPILQEVRRPDNLQQRRQQRRARQIQQQLQQRANERQIRQDYDRLINRRQYQRIFSNIMNDETTLTANQALRLYNDIRARGRHNIRIVINGREQYIPVNETTRDFIMHILTNGFVVEEGEVYGSDVLDNLNIQEIESFTIIELQRPQRIINNRDGRFFPHLNTTNLDLSDYQIFNQEQAYDDKIVKREHCLIHTLLKCGVDKTKVNEVKMTFKSGCNFKKKDVKHVAGIVFKNIVIHQFKPDGKIKKTETLPNAIIDGNPLEKINIAIYENHYFKFEETKYSKFFIDHYEELKDVEDNHKIVKFVERTGKYEKADDRKINSLLMMKKLLEQGHFKKLDMVKFEETASHQELRDHVYLENIDNEQRKLEEKDKEKALNQANRYTNNEKLVKIFKKLEEKAEQVIYYADCESYVNDKNVEHKLQLLGVANDKDDYVCIFNVCDPIHQDREVEPEQHLIYEFLNTITKNGKNNALVYFHNLKYDYHLLEQYLNIKKKCEKDNAIYNVIIIYKNCEIELRDSFKLIPFALSKFQKEFNLPKEFGKKEAINYEYYTKENNNKIIKIDDYRKNLSYAEQEIFNNQIHTEPSYNMENKTFNPLSYYKEYLRLDCLVLKKGIQKFNTLIQEITENKMNVYECLTISSLTDKYMIKEGAYDDVYEVKGNLRAYIAKAVYGGRVCVNEKYKKKVIEGKISDYDGVSLYPSAINRLCREIGLPKGKAKRFTKEKQMVKKFVEVDEEIYKCQGFGYDRIVGIVNDEYYYYGYWDKYTKGKNEYIQGKKLDEKELKRLNRYLEHSKKSSIKEIPKARVKKMVLETDNNWKDKTYSILTVKINKVNKHQQMPFIAHKGEGSIHYTNTPPEKPIIIDSITLEDYINFHDIEYEILDGVYWNEGTNKKMGEVVQTLFDARLKYKKTNVALANVIKLMLNSSYGKTIMKKTNTETKIVKTTNKSYNKTTKKWVVHKKTDFENYVYNNFNTIKRYRKLNKDNYEVEKICADNSYNRGHIGCAILSMSKRIMNEVFNVANDNNYPIYYTDTDSLHCNLEDVPKLEAKYKERYNKELNGKNLEQFHTDFDLNGACGEIYATKSIFLGKKSYYDKLESKDKDGNTITGQHIRLKGITEEGLEHTAKKYNGYENLYTELSKGEKIKIILNPFDESKNKNKVLFDFKEGKVSTKKEFTREVKF